MSENQSSTQQILRAAADRLEALTAAASPGSWSARIDDIGYYIDGARGCVIARTASPGDSDLIAAMRVTVRGIAQLMRLEADTLAADRPPGARGTGSLFDAARDLLEMGSAC